jgi:four helix bundle protein
VKSGTSVGANFCEADDAESSKDFLHKIGICKKEARETLYWLEIISKAVESITVEAEKLSGEAKELVLIFGAIVRKIKNKNK